METLYRKYRPQTFSEVVGQKPVVETLERAIRDNKVSHAYLFCGPRGTGKTTMARLLAKSFVCDAGAAALPDGTCEACEAVATGRHPDVYELDAASRTGVDAVREEIVNRVDFAPAQARAKVYIIDEVHMLTTAAFNALLKTLEEPPSHVIFVLCTTDPQKIPATVLSRVQRFDFKNIEHDQMVMHLAQVVEREGWTSDPQALEAIATHAHGAMRNALSSLEQLSVFGNGQVTLDNARALFGEERDDWVQQALVLLADSKLSELFLLASKLQDEGLDAVQFIERFMSKLSQVFIAFELSDVPEHIASAAEFAKAKELASLFESKAYVMKALTLADDARLALRNATNAILVLEAAFTRMVLAGGNAVETKQDVPAARVAEDTPLPSKKPEAKPKAEVKPEAEPKTPAAPSSPTPKSNPVSHNTASEVEHVRTWKHIVQKVQEKSIAFGALLLSSQLKADDGATLTIAIPAGNAFTKKQLGLPENERLMHEVVEDVLGPRAFRYVEEEGLHSETSAFASSTPLPQEPAPAAVVAPPEQPPAEKPAVADKTPSAVQETDDDEDLLSMATEIFGDGVKVVLEDEEK